jgi:AcrR family transcriptional regulator
MTTGSRHEEVATAARRAMLRKGIGATLRDIAREGGFTTGLVTHYFPDKRAVIVGAFAAASEEFIGSVRERFAAAPNASALLTELVEAAAPRSPERQAEWRLWAEMWAYAGRDPEFAAVIVPTDMLWVGELEKLISRLSAEGVLRRDLDAAEQGAVLARLVDGLGLRAWLSGDWDGARAMLVAHLRSLGLPARTASRLRGAPRVAGTRAGSPPRRRARAVEADSQ